MPTQNLQNHRSVALDFLRGVAVLLVLCRHHALFAPLTRSGWIGVDLFFVLSGYLVSGLLFKEYIATKTVRPIRFWLRRGLKIYPLYYLLIGFTVLYIGIQARLGLPEFPYLYSPKRLLGELLFFQNYGPNIWNHTWSLAVEEHFYILLAVSFWVLARYQKLQTKAFPVFILLLCLACLIGRLYAFPTEHPERIWLYYTPTHLRLDALCAGVGIAWWQQLYPDQFRQFFSRSWLVLIAVICLVVSAIPIEHAFMATFGFTIIYIAFAIILSCFVVNKKLIHSLEKWFGNGLIQGVAWVGFYSYAVYLVHMPVEVFVFYPLHHQLGGNWVTPITFPFFVGLSVLIGWWLSRLIEQPVLRFRERWRWTK